MFKRNFFSLDKWIITALFFALSSQGFFAFSNRRDASQVGIESINVGNLSLVLLLLVTVIFTAVFKNFKLSIPFKIYPFRIYFFYVSVCLISVIFSENSAVSFAKLIFLIFELFILFFLCNSFMTNKLDAFTKHRLADSIYNHLILLINIFLVLVLIASLTSPTYQIGTYITLSDRMAGGQWFLWGPNFLGQYSAIALLICICRMLFDKANLFNLLMFAVALYIFAASQARTSMLSFIFGLMLISYYLNTVNRLGVYAVIFFISFFGIYLISNQITDYILAGQTFEQFVEGTGRLKIYQEATSLFFSDLKSFFLGQGYYVGSRITIPILLSNNSLSNVDNTYLEAALNSGIFAGILLAIFISSIIKLAIKKTNKYQPSNIEAFAVIVVIFFRSIAGPTFHQFGFDILILFVIVLKLYFSPKTFKVN